MQTARPQLNGTQFYDALAVMVTQALSGIIVVEHTPVIRKFIFQKGYCLAASSTDSEELPGSFLHHQQNLTQEQYRRYMLQATQPNVRQWDLATVELKWSSHQLLEAKKKHLFYVLGRLPLEKKHQLNFIDQPFPTSVPLITSAFSMLLFKSADWSTEGASHRLPFLYAAQDTPLSWLTNEHAKNLPNEAKQVATLIQEHGTWFKVREHSALHEKRLHTWMLFFTAMGMIQTREEQAQTPAQTDQKGLTYSTQQNQNIETFQTLLAQNKIMDAIDFAHQSFQQDASQHRLSILLIETIFRHDLVQQTDYQKMAFSVLESNMKHFASQYESFFLLGKLCLMLGQPVHGLKALARALQLRPDLGSLRDFIVHHTGSVGPKIVMETLSKHMNGMTHYALLGVDQNASAREITLAYRQCCKHFHPDRYYRLNNKHTSKQAKDVFKKMVSAHRVLKNVQKRQKYDLSLSPDTEAQDQQPAAISPAAKAFYELGILKMREKDYESAIFQFRLASQLEPNHRHIQDQLALAMTKQQEKERV
jgi:tetratricopeptide (TPR) repeat protein